MPTIIKRGEWGFDKAGPCCVMRPARGCWLHHSVTRVTNDPKADARAVQAVGIQRFGRLSYSWMFHPSGAILEGQAFNIGAHTADFNSTTFGLVLIGDYHANEPPQEMIDSVAWFLEHGQKQGWFASRQLLGGHRQAPGAATLCPGDKAMARIDHFNKGGGGQVDFLSEEMQRQVWNFVEAARKAGGFEHFGGAGRGIGQRSNLAQAILAELQANGFIGAGKQVAGAVKAIEGILAGEVPDHPHEGGPDHDHEALSKKGHVHGPDRDPRAAAEG